jgi:hypothetical protein
VIFRTFALGALATLLALLQTAAWVAIGSPFVRRVSSTVLALPTALLIGSALTGFAYAVLCAAGQVELAIAVCAGAGALALVLRRSWVTEQFRALARSYVATVGDRRWLWMIVGATSLLYWLVAITPPRDADVMRYHLAHVRQIVADGGWLAIPDYCYALPFAWSLNYLPFEYAGLPEVAHLLDWTLWLVAMGCLLEIALGVAGRWRTAALLLCGVFAYQPFVLKGATTAHADMYMLFEILAVTAWLVRAPLPTAHYGLLGFAAWIGMQSRYQAAAVGLGAAAALLVFVRRWRITARELFAFALGSGAALVLATPFYAFNWVTLGNPVWPMFTGLFHAQPTYPDQVANHFNTMFTGKLDVGTLFAGLRALIVSPLSFPVPHFAAGLLGVSLFRRSAVSAAMALFVAVYLVFWALTNPTLYGRYILVLLPPLVVGGSAALALFPGAPGWSRRLTTAGLSAVVAALVAVCGIYSWDSLVFLATGDLKRFHEYTWFYDVYDWANRSTAPDARFLVVVESGTSYYLDRAYRRADPCLSAVIDWPNVRSAEDLMQRLADGRYDYLLFHDQDWGKCLAGQQMSEAVHAARDAGLLETVEDFEVRLGTSRFLRQSHTSRALILKPRPDES